MPNADFSESVVEQAALAWFEGMGYAVVAGPSIAPGESAAERENYSEVVLARRLREAMVRLNPGVSAEAVDDAFRKVMRADLLGGGVLVMRNRAVHRMLVDGVTVEEKRADGSVGGVIVRVIDFDDPSNNDWAAVNQFTVTEGQHTRRPDIVVFLNGLPLAVIELKNAADEGADIWQAFNQLQTYKQQIPALFAYNELLVISDGLEARVGTLSADRERFMPWKTIEGEALAPASMAKLQVVLEGVFEMRRLLDLVRFFVVFEDSTSSGAGSGGVALPRGGATKKVAGYHQFHAVNKAVDETVRASAEHGNRQVGVVWHTQGSGKSLTMAFYAGRVIARPEMENPTIVVLTDRNDLDNQLFATFARCHEVIRQKPVQAEDRKDLRAKLSVAAGGVVFTTIQKFLPDTESGVNGMGGGALSTRRNIVVIADEAHRSQYDFVDGLARAMRDALPNASFIGFTGTPIEKTDASTRAVFGDYISKYDIQRAVEDKATVPIYYEARTAKVRLSDAAIPKLDEEFEEATEGEEVDRKQALKTKWAAIEAIVGSAERVALVADDIVKHSQARFDAMFAETGDAGKVMIVCMSRRICVDLYNAIAKLKPEWASSDDAKGVMKVVMTGSASDPAEWQEHIRTKSKREELANRFKDPKDGVRIVIVRDMWLTGFDAPCLHTLYVDKPMKGHGLMQAIARVNRVFGNKPGGLVVDYLGLAHELKQALAAYTESGGAGKDIKIDQEDAVAAMLAAHERCCEVFTKSSGAPAEAPFDWSHWKTGTPQQRLSLLPAAQERVLKAKDGKAVFLLAVKELSQAFALAVPHEETLRIRDDVGFFQAVRAALTKFIGEKQRSPEDVELALRQLVSRAVASEEVLDIFAAAGLNKPNIGVLSEEFLADVKGMPQRNLAVELLRKLLAGEIKLRGKRNVVQARSFAELLEQAIRRYQNRSIEAAQVIEELIELAREMREADKRGETLGLTIDELAFYDALEVSDTAVRVLGEPTLQQIARELVQSVRANTSIDWTIKESVRAKLRVIVKRILRKYGYPPDKQEKATQTVIEQAELLLADANS